VKIHLKRAEADHLALCGVYTKDNWALMESQNPQYTDKICKICKGMAGWAFFPLNVTKVNNRSV